MKIVKHRRFAPEEMEIVFGEITSSKRPSKVIVAANRFQYSTTVSTSISDKMPNEIQFMKQLMKDRTIKTNQCAYHLVLNSSPQSKRLLEEIDNALMVFFYLNPSVGEELIESYSLASKNIDVIGIEWRPDLDEFGTWVDKYAATFI